MKELTVEEARERQNRLAKMRALLFYHEVGASVVSQQEAAVRQPAGVCCLQGPGVFREAVVLPQGGRWLPQRQVWCSDLLLAYGQVCCSAHQCSGLGASSAKSSQ